MKESTNLKSTEIPPESPEIFPDALYHDTFQARARTRSAINRVLLDTKIGQRLVSSSLFSHPVAVEKERQTHHLEDLALAYESTALLPKDADLQKLALQDPDMQPLPSPSLGLNLPRNYNFEDKLSVNMFDRVTAADFASLKTNLPISPRLPAAASPQASIIEDARQSIQQTLNGQIYCSLRDKILDLATNRSWSLLIELILHFHTLPDLQAPLTSLMKLLGPQLFQIPEFRRQLTYCIISRIIILDFAGHESLAAYLVDLGFPTISDQEKAAFLTPAYLHSSLGKSWSHNQAEYFLAIQKLLELGILTEQSLRENPTFRHHVIEFSLKALRRNINFQVFQNKVKPLVEALGIFQSNELSLPNQWSLYITYIQLCTTKKIPANHEILHLFRRIQSPRR